MATMLFLSYRYQKRDPEASFLTESKKYFWDAVEVMRREDPVNHLCHPEMGASTPILTV